VADTNSIAEDTTTAITGDVLTNDLHPNGQPGADTPTSFVSWASTQATYGTFTDTGNGTYSYTLNNANPLVQGLDAGQTLTEQFNYTMQDADGDQSTATLTITINGTNDTPHITTDPGNPQGANDVVSEAGLATGSNAAANTEFAYGHFTVSDPDGLDDIQSVTINGTTIAIGSLAGTVIHGANGDLTVTAYNGTTGVADYTYELKTPTTDIAGMETNVFTLTTSDGTSTSAPATITIEITDDVPHAVADTNSIAEDTAAAITGDVLTNDLHPNGQPGADTPTSFVSWASTQATYGTFTDTGNGTYSYTLNNANPLVQALDTGETLKETFNYTMQDADGDQSTATLTITINGANDTPHITTDPGNVGGGNDVVYESGLATGSNAAANTELAYGHFTVSDPDGLDDIQSVTINGTTIAMVNLGANNVIHGANGDLTITAYNGTTGVADYTYELKTPTTDVAGTETNVFTLTTSDGTSISAPATITIEIVDDTPAAGTNAAVQLDDDALAGGNPGGMGDVSPDTANTSGILSHSYGADGAGSISYLTNGAPAGFTYELSGSSLLVKQGTTTVMTLTVDSATGAYTVTQNAPIDHALIQGENNQAFTIGYQVTDKDGDHANGTISLNINDDTPTAGNQSVTVGEGHSVGANLLITLDISGSMGDPSGVAGKTRLDLAKDALYKLMDAYSENGDVMVKLVTFSTTATIIGDHWMTVAEAKAAISSYSPTNTTNYDDALLKTMDAFDDSGAIAGGQNVSYFLSDGAPNQSTTWPGVAGSGNTYINAAEETAWENFLNTHEITSFALGMGSGANATYLDPIAYNGVGSGNETSSIIVTDLSQLSSVLVGTVIVPSTVTGNLITGSVDVSFGADGPGILKIVSIAHDVNGDGIDEVYNTSSAGYNAATTALTLSTHDGGTLVVNFTTGAYTYTSPSTMPLDAKEVFSYTVADHDGDTATANLTINLPTADVLVVGTSANDQTGQTVDHYIDHNAPLEGPITGGGGNDVLVGDFGGASKGAGATANIVFVLDRSGSMTTSIPFGTGDIARLQALKNATIDSLNDLYNSGAENVRVHLVSFNSSATDLGTFNLTVNGVDNATALANAIAAVNSLTATGNTNYEAALQSAHAWIGSSSGPLASADVNEVIFVSDGAPNTPNSNVSQYTDDANNILSHGFTIDAVGINVDTNALAYLDKVEGSTAASGSADNIHTAEELTAVIGQLAGGDVLLNAAGDDNIAGGDGNDIIFGDAINTDALADAHGLTTPDGAGWAVFEQLGWTEQQIVDYVKANHSTLATESGRTGGNDVINGGPGNDIIYGQEGNDIINGGAGNDILSGGTGNNILTGGLGADTFKVGAGNDHITDYSLAEGDKVDISAVLNTPDADHSKLGFHTADGKAVLDVYDSTDHTAAHLVGSVTFDNINATDLDSLLGQINLDHTT
jgi:VCBS repeat-containing protein